MIRSVETSPARPNGRCPTFVVLVGPPASGKTVIGHRVANRLGRPFFDSDTVGGLDLGHRVGDEDDELAMAEYEWFERLSNSDTPAVIAAPSSLLDRPRTWRTDDMWIVWLAEPVEALVDRLDDGSVGRMVEAAERRRPVLEELADHRVDVAGRSPQEVAEEIAEMFERRAART